MQGVTEKCAECGFEPTVVGDDQLGPELARLAREFETVIAEASASNCLALSSRPSPEVWSILEYVGHVVFIYDAVVEMCELVVDQELASFDGVDQDEYADNARFNDVAATEMSARIRDAGERARTALDSAALDRKLAFNGNPAPLRLLTVAMLHESHHHLYDVTELLAG